MSEQEKNHEKEDAKEINGRHPEKEPSAPYEDTEATSGSPKKDESKEEILKEEPVPPTGKAAAEAPEISSEESTVEPPESEIQKTPKPAAKSVVPEDKIVPDVPPAQNAEKTESAASAKVSEREVEDIQEEEEITSSDEEEEHEDKQEAAENKSYDSMNKKQLVAALRELIKSKPIPEIKKEVEDRGGTIRVPGGGFKKNRIRV
jgi:hypothetical protein